MWLLALLIGLLSGIVIGLVTVGGSIIVTSMLMLMSAVFHLQLNMKQIVTTTAFYTLFTTISGAIYFWIQRLVVHKIVLYFGIPALLSSMISSLLANSLNNQVLQGIFAFFSLLAAVAIILPSSNKDLRTDMEFPYVISIILSIIIGTVGGMIGVAAGFLYMPIFLRLFRLSVKQAIGTGMFVGGMLCVGTILGKLSWDYIRIEVIVPLSISGIIGVLIGGKLTTIISEKWLNLLMCLIIAAIAVQTHIVFLADSLMVPLPVIITVSLIMSATFTWLIFKYNPIRERTGA
ncbi:sulfite exporter TauE/SafE family protein [Pseudogracilibacillus auburnensis]|uniref:Probable membrane transporter protein n=2 Tax=Pseudogracilibacillus auburnensis TaxID=1494959 RepID=A0A2V3VQD2_9BACI|nr:sulfite exporter TauE/SafE family protein [Pseudogracilibacillus auburnensis]MBO1001860.1 sulfite exporter TauE/SafE family protein [Pseudogracilibacillus auburnensis]PXW83354.1 putative membrane protein YfcA [Pseudogracilibacillus auburnensis]